MLYKPKFIIDSEFKLEREMGNGSHLSALVENDVNFEFGAFEPPQAAPLQEISVEVPAAPGNGGMQWEEKLEE